nr:MAG TPA: hypothetical protein [Caudoviricetes sp.]
MICIKITINCKTHINSPITVYEHAKYVSITW